MQYYEWMLACQVPLLSIVPLDGRVRQHDKHSQQPAEAEQLLWKCLRGRGLEGYKFWRQTTVGSYMVDFVCLETQLIIEIDGGQHAEQIQFDDGRTAQFEAMGYQVMRFWAHEVLGEIECVLEQIRLALLEEPQMQRS